LPATAAGAATGQPSGGETLEATPEPAFTPPPTDVPITVIPPTGEVGEAYHEVIDGDITSPGQENTLTFTAAPGQEFFFGVVQADADLALVAWRAVDEAGLEVFNTCLGCGNPGTYTLERGGIYTVIVGEPESGVGQYQIVIASVRVHYFAISLGAPIGVGQPGPGAGGIETPGARDMYSFNADPGAEVYLGVAAQNGLALTDLALLDEDAVEVFRSCLGCGNPGVYTLERGGAYIVLVGGDNELSTGTYDLVIAPVRTDQFTVAVGDPIGDGFPGPGAGNIETPGARDVYTFTASPGQQVVFEATEYRGLELVDWRLVDETGAEVFATCLGCTAPGAISLERGGAYTLTVGGGTDIGTGPYQLSIQQP
jgi:hypothetical protein